jgi:hypothetical protein
MKTLIKLTAFAALGFWLLLLVSAALRLFGVWDGDWLVPAIGAVLILMVSTVAQQQIQIFKQIETVRLAIFLMAGLPADSKVPVQNPDLN